MKVYGLIATALSTLAMFFVSTASVSFIHSPELPDELKRKEN